MLSNQKLVVNQFFRLLRGNILSKYMNPNSLSMKIKIKFSVHWRVSSIWGPNVKANQIFGVFYKGREETNPGTNNK